MTIQKPGKKLYYSLRQVSSMTELDSSLIKRWEKEFPLLEPVRNRAGNRYYSDKELNIIFQIKDLHLVRKLPAEEVEHLIRHENIEFEINETIRLKRTIAEVRLELREIMELFE